jgi:hypothetical protein
MNKRIAPILAILAWLHGGRLAGADELSVPHRVTGLGDMAERVDKAFDWRQPWHASGTSQLGASWGDTDQHWAQGDDRTYSLSQSPAYAYAFSSFRYVSYVGGATAIGLDSGIESAAVGIKSDSDDFPLSL